MLHTLSRSPWQCDFACLLRTLTASDTLLLLQDGVLAALQQSAFLPALHASGATIYLLDEDLQARGIHQQVCEHFQRIDYRGFVRLVVDCGAGGQMMW